MYSKMRRHLNGNHLDLKIELLNEIPSGLHEKFCMLVSDGWLQDGNSPIKEIEDRS